GRVPPRTASQVVEAARRATSDHGSQVPRLVAPPWGGSGGIAPTSRSGLSGWSLITPLPPYWANDSVHLPGRLKATGVSENRHGGPVKCNAWFAGSPCF